MASTIPGAENDTEEEATGRIQDMLGHSAKQAGVELNDKEKEDIGNIYSTYNKQIKELGLGEDDEHEKADLFKKITQAHYTTEGKSTPEQKARKDEVIRNQKTTSKIENPKENKQTPEGKSLSKVYAKLIGTKENQGPLYKDIPDVKDTASVNNFARRNQLPETIVNHLVNRAFYKTLVDHDYRKLTNKGTRTFKNSLLRTLNNSIKDYKLSAVRGIIDRPEQDNMNATKRVHDMLMNGHTKEQQIEAIKTGVFPHIRKDKNQGKLSQAELQAKYKQNAEYIAANPLPENVVAANKKKGVM
jgi:hypothetical protein